MTTPSVHLPKSVTCDTFYTLNRVLLHVWCPHKNAYETYEAALTATKRPLANGGKGESDATLQPLHDDDDLAFLTVPSGTNPDLSWINDDLQSFLSTLTNDEEVKQQPPPPPSQEDVPLSDTSLPPSVIHSITPFPVTSETAKPSERFTQAELIAWITGLKHYMLSTKLLQLPIPLSGEAVQFVYTYYLPSLDITLLQRKASILQKELEARHLSWGEWIRTHMMLSAIRTFPEGNPLFRLRSITPEERLLLLYGISVFRTSTACIPLISQYLLPHWPLPFLRTVCEVYSWPPKDEIEAFEKGGHGGGAPMPV